MSFEKVSVLMKRAGLRGGHCGNCRFWRTEMQMDGEYCGWIGSCCNPKQMNVTTVECDDYCRHYAAIGSEAEEADDDQEAFDEWE